MNFNKTGYHVMVTVQRPKTSVSEPLRQQLYHSIEATFEPESLVACFTYVDLWFEAKTLTTQIKFFFNLIYKVNDSIIRYSSLNPSIHKAKICNKMKDMASF